jgi:hypothetical protein
MKSLMTIAALFIALNLTAQEYQIEATYQYNTDSLYFHQVLSNYIRDFDIPLDVTIIRLSLLATSAEGYEIVFSDDNIAQFCEGTLVPLPKSEIAIRRFISSQYELHRKKP